MRPARTRTGSPSTWPGYRRATRTTSTRCARWPICGGSASCATSRTWSWSTTPTSCTSGCCWPGRGCRCPRCSRCCTAWAPRCSTSARTRSSDRTGAGAGSTTSGSRSTRPPGAPWPGAAGSAPGSCSARRSTRPGPGRRDRPVQRAGAARRPRTGARWRCCAPTRTTRRSSAVRSGASTWRRSCSPTPRRPGPWSSCSGPGSTRAREPADRERSTAAALAAATALIDEVTGLDADRILRGHLALITATLRTNWFRDRPHVSFKIDPSALPDMPRPRPRFEIFVYAPRMEGVHLRFGPVARGGLRWSDRPQDYRTEILGLVKAQAVKNAVIVPVGAKGGFVVQAAQPGPAEVEACYRMFVSGLLDVTDNLLDGAAVPPPDVVRHDGDDAYLVVAADKGTARFSDVANDVAARIRLLAGRRVRLRRVGRLRPQGDGHHRPRRLGERAPALPGAGPRHPDRGVHRGRDRRHVRRRVRQRHAALAAHPAGRRVRPPARVRRPGSRPGPRVRRAPPAVRPPPLLVGRLRPGRDQRRRRGVGAHREGGADRAGDPGRARAAGRGRRS